MTRRDYSRLPPRKNTWKGDPPVPGTTTQTGWGGIVFNCATGPVTACAGTFTVPSLSGEDGSLCSIWIGIGNVMQTGIYSQYYTGSPGDNDPYPSWTTFIDGSGGGAIQFWSDSRSVTAGDSVTLEMTLEDDYWTCTQTNSTAGWSYSNVTSCRAVSIVNTQWSYPFNQAEWIIEKEGSSYLPDYGTLTWTGMSSTPSIDSSSLSYVSTVNTSTDQTPGTYSDGEFTMTWHAYS